MRYCYDHDFHIHSVLSSCSKDPQQTAERILQYAKENNLHTVVITDHYWDREAPNGSKWYAPQDFEHISQILPLPQAQGIRFLFGAETDMNRDCELGIPQRRFADFDFVIIPTTHLHMKDFTIEAEADVPARIAAWHDRLEAVLSMPLPFHKVGLAHLACGLIYNKNREGYLAVLEGLSERRMRNAFRRAAQLGVGIELNASDMRFADAEADTVLRMFRIAKAEGCQFYLGSDAHHPDALDRCRAPFERAIDYLELQESDKFLL